MYLYHASICDMKPGLAVNSSRISTYYPQASEAIDASRPFGLPARAAAIFCADDPEFALYFLMMQGHGVCAIHVYEVEAKMVHKAPFAVTHVVHCRIKQGEDISRLAQEYWCPMKKWNFYEYLTNSIRIVHEIDKPSLNDCVLMHMAVSDHQNASAM